MLNSRRSGVSAVRERGVLGMLLLRGIILDEKRSDDGRNDSGMNVRRIDAMVYVFIIIASINSRMQGSAYSLDYQYSDDDE